jgi:hypothetical protein
MHRAMRFFKKHRDAVFFTAPSGYYENPRLYRSSLEYAVVIAGESYRAAE